MHKVIPRLIIVITAILLSCAPTKHYYNFRVERFEYESGSEELHGPDSVLVLQADSKIDTNQLLSYDRKKLQEFADEHEILISFLDSAILAQTPTVHAVTLVHLPIARMLAADRSMTMTP